jgi:hypothetical protein
MLAAACQPLHLPRMPRSLRSRVWLVLSLGLMVGACERNSNTPGGETAPGAAQAGHPAGAPQSAQAASWNSAAAGPALFAAGGNPSDAVDVLPRYDDSTIAQAPRTDTLLDRRPSVDLLSRRGLVGVATVSPVTPGNFTGSCTTWQTAHVSTTDGPPADWSVGFISGHAQALPMDSMSALSQADSSVRAADVARVAAALPNDTAPSFHGLPFALRDAHRFILPSGDTVIAAEVVRRLNIEANPSEEHLLVIMERDTIPGHNGGPPPFIAAYSERTSGPEDDVESAEVLAAAILGRGAHAITALIIGRDYGDGSSYTLVQRVAPRQWRELWNSAYVGC